MLRFRLFVNRLAQQLRCRWGGFLILIFHFFIIYTFLISKANLQMAILKIRQEMVRNAFDLPFNKWGWGCGGKWLSLL